MGIRGKNKRNLPSFVLVNKNFNDEISISGRENVTSQIYTTMISIW